MADPQTKAFWAPIQAAKEGGEEDAKLQEALALARSEVEDYKENAAVLKCGRMPMHPKSSACRGPCCKGRL